MPLITIYEPENAQKYGRRVQITRYDKPRRKERSYDYIVFTPSSHARLMRVISRHVSYTVKNKGCWIDYILDFNPTSRKHYAELNCQPLDAAGKAAMKGRNGRPIVGRKWEINEAIYWYFLEILPPLRFNGRGFIMREFCTGNITTKYTQEGDRFFCEFVELGARYSGSVRGGLQ